jgi:hypothetical protein
MADATDKKFDIDLNSLAEEHEKEQDAELHKQILESAGFISRVTKKLAEAGDLPKLQAIARAVNDVMNNNQRERSQSRDEAQPRRDNRDRSRTPSEPSATPPAPARSTSAPAARDTDAPRPRRLRDRLATRS